MSPGTANFLTVLPLPLDLPKLTPSYRNVDLETRAGHSCSSFLATYSAIS